MTDNPNYRLYLESEFRGISKTLARIELSLSDGDKKFDEIEKKIGNLEIKEVEHVVNCPAMPKIDDVKKDIQGVKDDLEEYRFFKKYPKLGLIILVIFIATAGVTIYRAIKMPVEIDDLKTQVIQEIRLQEGVSDVTRGGFVKYNDHGISDSVKIR